MNMPDTPQRNTRPPDPGWIPATSTWISAFRWWDHDKYSDFGLRGDMLEIRFRDGHVHQYHDVTERVYNEFSASGSKGKFVHRILNFYRHNPG